MEIYNTIEYDNFKYLGENRQVSKKHAECLAASIQLNNMLHVNPIIVNNSMFVIDGQHRLEAAKILNLPIYYTVIDDCKNNNALFLLQTSKTWTITDFVEYYANSNPDYKIFAYHKEKYRITYDSLASIYALFTSSKIRTGIFSIKKKLKAGIFKLDAIDLVSAENAMQRYLEFKEFCIGRKIRPAAIHTSTPAALGFCCFAGFYNIDWDRFQNNLEERWHTLKPGKSYREHVKTYVEIYNHSVTRKKKMLAYQDFEAESFRDTLTFHKCDSKSSMEVEEA